MISFEDLHNEDRQYQILMYSTDCSKMKIMSEVSQKEKDKYCILKHIYGI